MIRYDYYKPRTLDEAWELQSKTSDARFVAGGTDLMVGIKNGVVKPPAVLSLRSIPDLSGVETGDVTRIGAMTTITDTIGNPEIASRYPVLIQAARELGSVQVRNVATIGGNLCNASPCADMALPLLVLDASVRLQKPGSSRDVPLYQFFTGPKVTCIEPGEILTHILIPEPPAGAVATFMKRGRVKMDIAVASVATLLHMDGDKCLKARVAAGSVAPVPLRLGDVEKILEGAEITKEKANEAQALAEKSVSPITDIRSTAEYRTQLVGVYTRRSIEQILGWSES
ncbi:MAG: xanthine dehydrogenase family protein subunit M [Deltaproteobacteria bacterium]|nr:xanthine dehydrogenase family protein subunit M [Deltaproteobacteria bacterium]